MAATVTKTIDKTKEMVTFSTKLVVNGVGVNLHYSRKLGYCKPNLDGYSFEEYFLFPEAAFTNEPVVPTVDGLRPMNHPVYQQMVASCYVQEGKWHELRWEIEPKYLT